MKPSLQTKLLVNFMLVVALILAGFAIGSSALIRQYFLSAKQQELIGKGQEMSRVMDDFMTGRLSAPELVELADRILVLCGGKVSGIVDGRRTDKRQIGLMMTRIGGDEHE